MHVNDFGVAYNVLNKCCLILRRLIGQELPRIQIQDICQV